MTKRQKDWWQLGLAAVFLIAALAFVPLKAQAGPPVVKEWHLPSLILMSGPWAAYGLEGKWGIEMAVEEVNASGGIRGLPLKLTWLDSAYDTAKTVQQMGRALGMKPLLIIGPQGDTEQAAACPIAAKEEVFILAGDGDNLPFEQNYPWGTTLMTPVEIVTHNAAAFWTERHAKDVKAVIMFTNLTSTTIQRQADEWRKVMEAKGLKVLPDIEIPPDAVDFRSPVLKALGQGADGFINITSPDQAAKLDIELRKAGVKEGFRIVNYLATNSPALYEIGKEYLEDTYTYDIYSPYVEAPRWQALLAKYREWKKDPNALPNYFPAFNHDLPFVIKQAFEACQITGDPNKLKEERVKIRDYILHLKDFETVQGYKINVIEKTGGARRPLYYYQIKSAKPQLLTTIQQ